MKRIVTWFDRSGLPMKSLVSDDAGQREYIFYLKGTGLKLRQIHENMGMFSKEFETECMVVDFKTHLKAFKLPIHLNYNIYDKVLPFDISSVKNPEKVMEETIGKLSVGKTWESLRAKASVVYQHLENNGLSYFNNDEYPIYRLDTVTGRSKTLGFNIQGQQECHDLFPRNSDKILYIHLDWTAADIKMASFMAGDPKLEESFTVSDPYTYVSEYFESKLPRDEVKTQFLQALYKLAFDDPIFDLFPKFREHMEETKESMHKNGYIDSILGRRFRLRDNALSTFNSHIQGSVVHAMQATLVRIFEMFPNAVFAEIHDSIVLAIHSVKSGNFNTVLDAAPKIMLDPLSPYLKFSPRMPLKVSLGKHWKGWKLLRVYK